MLFYLLFLFIAVAAVCRCSRPICNNFDAFAGPQHCRKPFIYAIPQYLIIANCIAVAICPGCILHRFVIAAIWILHLQFNQSLAFAVAAIAAPARRRRRICGLLLLSLLAAICSIFNKHGRIAATNSKLLIYFNHCYYAPFYFLLFIVLRWLTWPYHHIVTVAIQSTYHTSTSDNNPGGHAFGTDL